MWTIPKPPSREQLHKRFHEVIIKRGYSECAADGILREWFDKYMQDVPAFVKMLEAYESGND